MADTSIKIVSLANLQSYDTLIKKYVTDADAVVDAKSVKNVAVSGDFIYFFKQDVIPTTESGDVDTSKASASVKIASSDVAQLLTDVAELKGTVVGYSSTNTVASAIATAKSEAESYADEKVKDLADGAVATNTAAIAAINNANTGILAQATAKVNELANGQVKTNKEAIDAINDETTGILATAKSYTDAEAKKITDSIGTVSDGQTVVSMIADAKKAGTDAQSTIDDYKTANDTRVKAVEDRATALETTVGDTSTLTTTSKEVVGALNELKTAVSEAESAGEVTIDTSSTTEGYLKSYTIKQGGTTIGVVDIPKDLVVTSGEVVVDPEGQPAGTYIKLVIANQESPIFINVKSLVDVYTAEQSATQIQLAISATNEISATIVAGSVGTTEIADDAIVTTKIADKNVTLAKLSDAVQASLALADSALQSSDITTGSANGTIAVEGTDVAVKGLGSAAFTESSAYDASGSAAQALADAKQYADDLYTIASSTDISNLFQDAE